MKTCWFHVMPYRFLPENFENDYRSVRVDVPQSLYDGRKVHGHYNDYLDELEHAERCGFDGLCVNEHHQNAYGAAPVLMLWGEGDRANPPVYAQDFAQRIRAAAVLTLPGGHMLHLESPDAVADTAVEFLSS
jgi:pimeloyl-ACP methyl ester carboxylesterase